MKINKTITTGMLMLVMALFMAGCGGASARKPDPAKDLDHIREKGEIVVGVTEFAPMDYKYRDSWTGFDADMAKLFAKRLGVTVRFSEIEWEQKAELLASGDIDLVWNGMTRTDEVEKNITCSVPYMSNAQVIVMRSENLPLYSTIEDCDKLLFACEKGSVGKDIIARKKYRFKVFPTQKAALQAVTDLDADAAIVDRNLSIGMTGPGSAFEQLTYGLPQNEELYCVGMRKGSSLCDEINAFFAETGKNGVLYSTAAQYNLQNALIDETAPAPDTETQ